MEKSFDSPTTPGLPIDFRNYVVELVCLNMDKKLGPRFWKSNNYWAKKYPREIKGISNLSKLTDFNNPLIQKLLIGIIKDGWIKSLSAKKTLNTIIKKLDILYKKEIEKRKISDEKIVVSIFSPEENARYVDTGTKNKLSILKDIEENGKKE
jgi:hypothetical protein